MDDSVYADETDVKELLDVSNFDDYDASAGSQKSGASRFNPFNKRPDSSIRHAVNGDVSTHDAAGAPVLQFKEDDDSDDDQLLNLDHTSQGSHRFENPWSSMYPNPNDPDDDDRLLVVIREGFCKGGAGAACDDSCPRHGGNSTIQQEDNDHCHRQRTQSRSKPNDARNRLICASILCLVFVIAEVVGGYFANSLAIMTDAAHMLSDFASFLISLFAIWFAQRPPTKKMSFGYHRAEVLGAVVSVMIIWVLTGVLIYMAVQRVISPTYEIDTNIMLITSGCGVAMNLFMGAILHGGCCGLGGGIPMHGHSHGGGGGGRGHSHGGDSNINVRAAFIHVVGDFVQSIGVLIAAYVIHYKPEWKLADPICTFMFSILVLITTINIMKDAVNVLMEGVPRDVDYDEVKADLLRLPGVESVHSLCIWVLTMSKNAVAVHIAIRSDVDPLRTLSQATELLRLRHHFVSTTIQVEPYDASIMSTCTHCIGPTK